MRASLCFLALSTTLAAQIREEKGKLFPATNPLDAHVDVPQQERSAAEHLTALCDALGSYFHIELHSFDGNIAGFDREFAAQPARFTWGTNGLSARDAIIDLLGSSATTFSWRLYCQENVIGSPLYRLCVLNMIRLEI